MKMREPEREAGALTPHSSRLGLGTHSRSDPVQSAAQHPDPSPCVLYETLSPGSVVLWIDAGDSQTTKQIRKTPELSTKSQNKLSLAGRPVQCTGGFCTKVTVNVLSVEEESNSAALQEGSWEETVAFQWHRG